MSMLINSPLKLEDDKIKVVIVNGPPGVGKTTFEEICIKLIDPFASRRSTIDIIKEYATILGWDGTKDARGRRFLSDLKDALTRYNDLPFHDIIKFVDSTAMELESYGLPQNLGIIFIDCREPEEIEKLKSKLNAVTVFIDRPQAMLEISNHADKNVGNYDYDVIIDNSGTFEDLSRDALTFLKAIDAKFEIY